MSLHNIVHKAGVYFITFTCHDWLPLIDLSDGYGAVYRFFKVLRRKGHTITGYVIMPNHLHILLHYKGEEKSLNTLIGNGKRFMAYEMFQALEGRGEQGALHRLAAAVQAKDRTKGLLLESCFRYKGMPHRKVCAAKTKLLAQ